MGSMLPYIPAPWILWAMQLLKKMVSQVIFITMKGFSNFWYIFWNPWFWGKPIIGNLHIIWLVVDLPLWKIWVKVNGKDDIPYMKWKIIQSCSKPPTSHRTKRKHRISNQSTCRPLDTHCLLLKDLGCSGMCRNSEGDGQPAAKWREEWC